MAYIDELAKALRHEDPDVRVKVANALKELEDPRATIPLIEALDDECEEVRRAIAWALQNCADHRALPTFIRMLRDHNDSVRLWAAYGLQRIGDTTTVETLIEALSDEYDGVRMHAATALARIGDPRAINPLIKALDDPEEFVRTEAELGLREGFKIRYDPVTRQTEAIIVEKDTFDVESMPPDEREMIEAQLQIVLGKMRSLVEETGVCNDDVLWDLLYLEYGLHRRRVADLVGVLIARGLIESQKPGYYRETCIHRRRHSH